MMKKQRQVICSKKAGYAKRAYTLLVERTPIDTGHARGNWQVTIGKGTSTELDRTTKKPLDEELRKCDTMKGDEVFFIQNNAPYITSLEFGHSKQAPNGMVALTLLELEHYTGDN